VKTRIVRGIGYGCDEAAASAIQQTQFKPGIMNGVAVRVKITIPIRFGLRKSPN
jgi:protein TonB